MSYIIYKKTILSIKVIILIFIRGGGYKTPVEFEEELKNRESKLALVGIKNIV